MLRPLLHDAACRSAPRARVFRVLALVVLSAFAVGGAKTCSATEQTDVASIRNHDATLCDAKFVRAVQRIDELRGQFTFVRGNLVGVDLSAGRISVVDADLAVLDALPHLSILKLSGGEITSTGISHVARLGGLVELAIQDAQIDDAGLRRLASMKHLKSLRLRRCIKLTDDGLACLDQFSELTHLALIENSITDQGVDRLKHLTELVEIDLRGCSAVTDAGLARLKPLSKLKALRLGGYAVTDASLAVVKDFPKLTSLTIEDASISDAGLAELRKLPIDDLSIARCLSFGDAALAQVKNFSKLRRLSLRDTAVTGAGMVHLAGLKSLYSLTIVRCGMDDAGLQHLADLAELELLNLQADPGITDASIDHLRKLTSLKTLVIGQTSISDQGVAQLRAALPRCKIVRQ
jgi:Leucine-rich repeat (LRR) protein